MNIEWPQGIYLALIFLTIGINLARDGQPRNVNYSFSAAVIAASISFSLLYWGGFFSGGL